MTLHQPPEARLRRAGASAVALILVAPPTGEIFVLEGSDNDVHRVGPGANGVFDGVPPVGDGTAIEFDTLNFGADDHEGIAYHPTRGTLLIVDFQTNRVYERNRELMLINVTDISASRQLKTAASIQFTSKSARSGATTVQVRAVAADNTPTFAMVPGNVSAWPRTTADTPPTGQIAFRGDSRFIGNVTSASVTVPPSVQPRDALILTATMNAATATNTESANLTSHTTPSVTVGSPGSWLVSYWADKSSTTTDWTAPAGVAVRDEAIGTGSGRIAALLGDSGGPVPTGTAAGRTATTDAASRAATVSIVLAAAP